MGSGFPRWHSGKRIRLPMLEMQEDAGSILGLGRSPGEGNDNLLQYSCLENPMDRDWQVTVQGVKKRLT